MFDYKRFSFILLLLIVFLIATDTSLEKQARKSSLSFFNIVLDESSTVSETAPSSVLDTLETGRMSAYNYLNKQDDKMDLNSRTTSGVLSIAYLIAYYVILFLKFICNYVITFYPFIIFLLYAFLTSRIFRREDNFPTF